VTGPGLVGRGPGYLGYLYVQDFASPWHALACAIVGEAKIRKNWCYLHSEDAHYWMAWLNVDPPMLQADVRRKMEALGYNYDVWRRIMLPREKGCILRPNVL